MLTHAYNASIWEVEAGRSQVQDQIWLHYKFEAIAHTHTHTHSDTYIGFTLLVVLERLENLNYNANAVGLDTF